MVLHVGTPLALGCTSSSVELVRWAYLSLNTQNVTICERNNLVDTSSSSRYMVSSLRTISNLTISSVQFSDAGTYACCDFYRPIEHRTVSSALLGVIGDPEIYANDSDIYLDAESDCRSQGDSGDTALTCRVVYNGSGLMPLHMTWSQPDGRRFETNVNSSSSTGLFVSTRLVPPTMTTRNVSSYSCTVSVGVPAIADLANANNAPRYSATATTQVHNYPQCPNTSTPVVDDINPKRHIITGGTMVFVTGRNFHLVNRTTLIVTMVYSPQGIYGIQNVTEFVSEPCTFNNDTLVTCVIPTIILPEEFKNLTDSSLVSSSINAARRKRSQRNRRITSDVIDRPSNVVGSWHRARRSPTGSPRLDFYEAVVFDNVYMADLSNSLVFIQPTQKIIPAGELQTFDPSDPRPVAIKGSNLLNGITVATDYTVLIGDGFCRPQGQLTDNLFYCQPPETRPNMTKADRDFCKEDFVLLVQLSNRALDLGSAGCLRYELVDRERPKRVAIIIGCATAGGLLLLLITAAVVFCLRVRRREKTPAYTTHIDVTSGIDVGTRRPSESRHTTLDDGYARHIEIVHLHLLGGSITPQIKVQFIQPMWFKDTRTLRSRFAPACGTWCCAFLHQDVSVFCITHAYW